MATLSKEDPGVSVILSWVVWFLLVLIFSIDIVNIVVCIVKHPILNFPNNNYVLFCYTFL